jgi:tetratricopeptide (TPR) repeat protein
MLKFISFIFLIILSLNVSAKVDSTKSEIEKIFNLYAQGEYDLALRTLEKVQINLQTHQKNRKDIQGFVYYWQGLCLIKLNEYEDAIKSIEKAIKEKFNAKDLYYEYGQALYTSFKLKKAREAFKLSVKSKYKRGVSLYYIAYISQELGDLKTAVSFYEAIEKLPDEEKKDIVQAARLQIGDIYFEQVKKRRDSIRAITNYVLPQYRKALKWDKESTLADDIRKKIDLIERRYDLVLFYLRNGRPTARPPYFMKHNLTYTQDDNVNLISNDTKETLEAEDYAASSLMYSFFGRYSFYPNNAMSVVPQLSLGYTKYNSDNDNIKVNNNFFVTTTLQTTYEHIYNKAPATFFLDVDYTYSMDDADNDENLEKASDGIGFTFSEQLQFWRNNPTIFRLKYSTTDAQVEESSFVTYSAVYEQMILMGSSLFYLTSSYNLNDFPDNEAENNSSVNFRADFIMANSFQQISPNLYYSIANKSYEEDSVTESLSNYGINLSRSFGKNWFVYLDYSMSTNTSSDESREYDQSIIRFSIDYIY